MQGALDQAGRQRAAASACATQGELAGRTCAGEAFCRPLHVRLAAEDEVDLHHGQHFDVPGSTSKCPPPLAHRPSAAFLPSFTYKEKNKLFLFPSNT